MPSAKKKPVKAHVVAHDTNLFDQQRVRLDVGMSMRDVVVRSTLFTDETYSPNLVPSLTPPQGWEAT